MKFSEMPAWVPVVAALIAAGMYIGALAQRVTNIEREQEFYHGSYQVPGGK